MLDASSWLAASKDRFTCSGFRVGDVYARQVGKLLVPAVFAASVSQVNALIDTILASTLITGSISWLYYSDRLLELPIGLVAVALHLGKWRMGQCSEERVARELGFGQSGRRQTAQESRQDLRFR